MRKFAALAIAALLSMSLVGCGDSDKKAGSSQGEIPASSKEVLSSVITNQTSSGSAVSVQGQTSQPAVSSTASQNKTDTQEVQNQLNELEKILDGLDDITEDDLVVPEP